MAHLIFKTRRDADLYLMWSTVCDAPLGAGDRAAIEKLGQRIGPRLSPELLARIDTTGTSAMSGEGGWDDSGMVLREFPRPTSESRWLPRESFHDLAVAVAADDDAAIEKVGEPIDPAIHPVITIVFGDDEETKQR